MAKKPAKKRQKGKKEMAKRAVKTAPEKRCCGMSRKNCLHIGIAVVVLLAIACIIWYIRSTSETFEGTMEKMSLLDQKYGLKWDDWKGGLNELWYQPRIPNPLSMEDIDAAIRDFSSMKDDIKKDRPSLLIADARVHLLNAEKYYRITKSKPARNFVEDGFSCSDEPYVLQAAKDINSSIFHGRIAASELKELYDSYPDKAKTIDITHFYVRSLNESFTAMQESSEKNVYTIQKFCVNGTARKELKIVNGTVVSFD